MNDETTTVIVVAAALGAFVFLAVQFKVQKAKRQHSLGDLYRPKPKDKEPPAPPHW